MGKGQYKTSIGKMLETMDDYDLQLIYALTERLVAAPLPGVSEIIGDSPDSEEHAVRCGIGDNPERRPSARRQDMDWSPPGQLGVFWLEIERWGPGNSDTTTISHWFNLNGIPCIGRKVEDISQFHAGIEEWMSTHALTHPILYLAFHGEAGQLIVGDYEDYENWLGLRHIEDLFVSRGQGGLLYFASCGTMGVKKRRLQEFLENTGFCGVCGYRSQVEWIESAMFDMMFLSKLAGLSLRDGAALRQIKDSIKADLRGLYKRLQFRMVVAS